MTQPRPSAVTNLWAAFIGSHLVLVGVSFAVPAEPALDPSLVPLFGLPAMVFAGLAAEGSVLKRAAPAAVTWFILRFALAEAAGLLGFVSYFVSGERLVQFACAGAGLLAHLACFPSARAFEDHASR